MPRVKEPRPAADPRPGARPAARQAGAVRHPRAVADRPSAWRLLLRRQRRLLRPVLGVAAAAVLLVGGGVVAMRATVPNGSLSSFRERLGRAVDLRVTDVVIEGRSNTPEPLLRAALGVVRGDRILGFSVEAARANIERLSWVQHVSVERHLPGTVLVALTERRPFAIWQNQGRFQLIDRQGEVVAGEDIGNFGTLPLVVGVGAPQRAAAMLELLNRQPAVSSHVAALVRVGERRWNLRLNNGTDVLLPENQEVPALARLAELQGTDQLLDRPLGAIDLRLPDRLVVRPLTGPPAPVPAKRAT